MKNCYHSFCFSQLLLLVIFFFQYTSIFAQGKQDSLYHHYFLAIEEAKKEDDLIKLNNELLKLKDSLKYEQSLQLFHNGLNKSLEQKAELASIYYIKNIIHSFNEVDATHRTIDSIYQLGISGAQIAEKIDSNIIAGKLHNRLGGLCLITGDLMKGLDNFHNALRLFKKSNKDKECAFVLGNISNIHSNFKNYEKAINYSLEAIDYGKNQELEIKNFVTAFNYGNLVYAYFENKEYEKSKEIYNTGISFLDSLPEGAPIKNKDQLEFNLLQSGLELYMGTDHIEKSKRIYNRLSKSPYFNSSFGIFLQIRYHLKFNNLNKVENLLEEAPSYMRDTSMMHGIRYLIHRSTFYQKLGSYEEAFKDFKKAKRLQDELENKRILNYAEYMQSKLAIEEKENQIKLLSKENEFKSLQYNFTLIGLIISLLVFSFFIYQNKKIKKQAKLIENETQIKENLFSNISHELKTPLTIINASAHKLNEQNIRSDSSRQNVKLIINSSNQLLELSQQILTLIKSKFQATNETLYSFNISKLKQHIESIFKDKAENQNIDFQFTLKEHKEDFVCDVNKLLTIIKNLNQNAIKFCGQGGTIKSNLYIKENRLYYSITDSGMGISASDLPFIFDRFYQTESNKSSQAGGIGLGLAICKENIDQLEGSISVNSKLNQGSIFSISIPIKNAKSIDAPSFKFIEHPETLNYSLNTIQDDTSMEEYILIVEDNKDLCFQLKELLQDDYHLSFAHDGNQALQHIEINEPKAIITDWLMKGMDGFELVKYLKSDEAYAKIPILMLTAKNNQEDRISLLRIGVDGYITKPFNPENVQHQLNHLITLADKRNEDHDNRLEGISKADFQLLKKLEHITKENISDFEFNLSILSSKLEISKRQLNRKVRQLTGLTPMQYINEIRFEMAKQMLEKRESTTVKQVIYSVGFKGLKNFSRNFKKRYGKYPKDFLNN